jgi:xanthine dehydrogenase accessory factor
MTMTGRNLRAFLDAAPQLAMITVTRARGSTPREEGAFMLVSQESIFGTIGGGQLEFLAIANARELMASNKQSGVLEIPLGPEIGQCCGGRVALDICLVDKEQREKLLGRAEEEERRLPHVYLFGGGHVGRALAEALALLPVRATVVETRGEALQEIAEGVATRLTPVPEEAVREAPPGSAFVVLTHDHALDFLIVAEALRRPDAAYVGMIGSKTKRETFRRWYLKEAGGREEEFRRLVTPIGGSRLRDKRPAVIAALAAAEIMTAIAAAG